MRRALVAILLLAPIAACKPWEPESGNMMAPQSGELRVEDAWVRLPPVAGRPGAAYFTLRGGSSPAVLDSVSSPQVQRTELHNSVMEGGVMRMVPLTDRGVPANGRVAFAPGGRHVMLFGIDPAVERGWHLPLNFQFQGGRQVTVEAEVRGAGDAGPVGH